MTDLATSEGVPAYSLSSVHITTTLSDPLVIVRPSDEAKLNDLSISRSSIHFRKDLPAVLYKLQSSRLILSVIGSTDIPATVFECGTPITGVGLHDDSTNLIVHLFLRTSILYSMIIPLANLENPALKRTDGWITEYAAPSFQIRTPLSMHTISATNIIFTLADGGLLRLANNGRGYNEHLFSDSSYFSSFKSILPWSGRPSNLVISMQGCIERNVLFTLSVDAKLKAWDIKKGALLTMKDAHHQPLSFLLEPSPANFIALHNTSTALHVVTYCPGRPGCFKLFKARGNVLDEVISIPEEQPQGGLWLVFDTVISRVRPDGQVCIHVLWKIDNLSLLQTGHLDPNKHSVVWSFALDTTASAAAPEQSSQKIADFLFTPERFSPSIFKKALETETLSQDIETIRTEVHSLITSSTSLQYDEETGNELRDQYEDEMRLKYLKLANICLELDRAAGEPHSLVASTFTGETIIVCTAKISLVRLASQLETAVQAAKTTAAKDTILGTIRAALLLQEALAVDAWLITSQTLREESLGSRTLSSDDAMFVAYEKTLDGHVSRATVNAIADLSISPAELLDSLHLLLRLFQPNLKGYAQGILGVNNYTAGHRGAIGFATDFIVKIVGLLLFSACSTEEVDVYRASALYIEYLTVYKQLLMIDDTLRMVTHSSHDSLTSSSNALLTTKDQAKNVTGQLIFYGLANSVDDVIPIKDFLERVLVFLINHGDAANAAHFSTFVGCSSPFACYLRGRSLLLSEQYTEATEAFARNSFPLVNSPKSHIEKHLSTKLSAATQAAYFLHIADLFSTAKQYNEAARFCNEAQLVPSTPEQSQQITQRLFSAALDAQNWDEAYQSLTNSNTNDNVRKFLTALCESHNAHHLSKYPFIGLHDQIDIELERKAHSMLDVRSRPEWHKILYAFRIQHNDFRGASAIIYHRLQVLKNNSRLDGFNVSAHIDITEGYLLIINALRCVKPENAWIIVGALEREEAVPKRLKLSHSSDHSPIQDVSTRDAGPEVVMMGRVKRQVLQLKDIKCEYDRELKNMDAQLQQLAGLAY